MSKIVKVLTIREPWVTLIKSDKKHIETRTWKTNYRGIIYIHAGGARVNKKDSMIRKALTLIAPTKFTYGHIVLKCNLVDCIRMDKKFVDKIKQNKEEYMCGMYKEGYYAWILKDIEVLSNPIKAKGQLGIWNFKLKDEV